MKKQSFSKKMNLLLADDEDLNESEVVDETTPVVVSEESTASNVSPIVAPVHIPTPNIAHEGSATDSIIGINTKICGELTLSENIQILGQIDGNVITSENVKVCGTVTGDVKGTNVTLDSGVVKGNITASGSIFISSNSTVVGDIEAETLILSGTTKGNITAKQSLKVKSSADHEGDICANYIGIEEGAKFTGRVTIAR